MTPPDSLEKVVADELMKAFRAGIDLHQCRHNPWHSSTAAEALIAALRQRPVVVPDMTVERFKAARVGTAAWSYAALDLHQQLNAAPEKWVMPARDSSSSLCCRLCGKGVEVTGAYLKRVNEKGVPGIWEHRPSCEPTSTNEEAIIAAIKGDDE